MAAGVSERSKITNKCGRAVRTGDVKVPNALVSMLLVLQIPYWLLLTQSYSLYLIVIDNFMFSEATFKYMFSGVISLGTWSKLRNYLCNTVVILINATKHFWYALLRFTESQVEK